MIYTEIKSVDELLLIKDMDANYKLTCDLDLGERIFLPLGTTENPFRGVFDGNGHHIKNINIRANDAGYFGLFEANEGTIQNVYLDRINIFGKALGTAVIGGVCGVNYGKIYGVYGEDGKAEVSSDGELIVGTFAGINYGEIVNGILEVNLKISGNGKMTIGGFAGETKAGLLRQIESTGEIDITADKAKLILGMYAGIAKNTALIANTFASPWNTLNGKLFRDKFGKKENIITEGNLWRDNRNDDRLLSKKKLQVRAIVEEHMRRMGSVEWTPDKTLTHTCTCLAKIHRLEFPAGVKQYGIPYSHHCGSYERFMACFDENGNLQPWIKESGYDGWDLYMGNDCSMAVYFALARISGDITYEWTWSGAPMWQKGTIPIPGYDAMFTDNTGEIIEKNGKQAIAEAFAKQHKGDPMVHAKIGGGHFRLCAKNAVIFRQDDGQIDCKKSYARTHEQGDGLFLHPPIGWLLDWEYSLEHLFEEQFIPMTTPELQKGEVMKAEVSYIPGKKSECPLTSGTVKSNYRIISVTEKIYDTDGNKTFEKLIFPDVHGYDGHGNDEKCLPLIHKELDEYIEKTLDREDHITRLKKEYNMRETIKEVDLSIFKPYINEACGLESEKKYHFEIQMQLTNGNTYCVCDGDFTCK